MFDQTHAHITTWAIALILFIIAIVLNRGGNAKGTKIVHMILRLFYILIIVTGVMLFARHSSFNPMLYGLKFLGGLVVISMMEMVLIRSEKDKKTTIFWAILIIAFIVTFLLGIKLPLGWNWLS